MSAACSAFRLQRRMQVCLLVPYMPLAPQSLRNCNLRRLRNTCGVAAVHRIATRLLAAADASMSYETAQKVRQQQVRDRLAYALIIFLGFVALYINIKRTVKEAAEWEKEHN